MHFSQSFLIPFLSLLTGLGVSYQDIRTQRISIWLLGIFVVLSTLMGVTREWENGFINSGLTMMLMITLLIIVSLYERIRRKSLLGSGDKILLVCCCGWLDVSQIPYLLILAGTFGTVIALLLKITSNNEMDRPIPFAPGILGALVILG